MTDEMMRILKTVTRVLDERDELKTELAALNQAYKSLWDDFKAICEEHGVNYTQWKTARNVTMKKDV